MDHSSLKKSSGREGGTLPSPPAAAATATAAPQAFTPSHITVKNVQVSAVDSQGYVHGYVLLSLQ